MVLTWTAGSEAMGGAFHNLGLPAKLHAAGVEASSESAS